MADTKKPKVIHARVPEALESEVKARASRLGLSVSTLVRNILLNTFGLVEDIVTDSAAIARSAAQDQAKAKDAAGDRIEPSVAVHPPTVSDDPLAGVLAWQSAILNVNAVCARCNVVLPKGDGAAIGVSQRPGPTHFLCTQCVAELQDERNDRIE